MNKFVCLSVLVFFRPLAILVFFCLSLVSCPPLHAQSRELALSIGAMDYKGDLEPAMYDNLNTELGFGLHYRRPYNNHWTFKMQFVYGRIKADDADSEDAYYVNRNLNFRSHIIELSPQIEFNFFPYQTANPTTRFSPYLTAGLSVFHFNPKASFEDDWITLQILGTEGQGTPEYPDRKPYKRTSAALVFGGGIKASLSNRFGIVLESAVRRTYTDYLDDVSSTYADPAAIRREYGKTAALLSDRSLDKDPAGNIGRQRGDTEHRDWYVYSSIQLTFTLSKKYISNCAPFRPKTD